MIFSTVVSAFLMASLVHANWDPATGSLRDFGVTEEWLSKNKPAVITKEIQASECAINTRLHFPNIQLFALFRVNHEQDYYHGCPYGDCWAFTVAPSPGDMIPTYTHEHSYFWHHVGGLPFLGVKPISNPQTGVFGYEESLSGHYVDGKPDTSSLQLNHDGNYPTFAKLKLTRWTPEEVKQFENRPRQPMHPKCGTPCGPNKDPGSVPGAYGNYHPASASAYSPPPSWQPSDDDQCFHNGTAPGGNSGHKGNGTSPVPTKPGNSGNKTTPTNPGKGGNNTQPISGGSSKNGTHSAGSPKKSPKPKHSSGKHCKKYCKCLKKCQGDDCDSCEPENAEGCTKKDCDDSNAQSRRCL